MSLKILFKIKKIANVLCIQIVFKLKNYYLLKDGETLHILLTLFCLGSSMDLQSVNGFMYERCMLLSLMHLGEEKERTEFQA